MKKYLLYFAVCLIGFSSCENEIDEGLKTYVGIKMSSRITQLYGKDGEITDRTVVERFSNAYGDFNPNMNLLLMTNKYRATYLDASTVVVMSGMVVQ